MGSRHNSECSPMSPPPPRSYVDHRTAPPTSAHRTESAQGEPELTYSFQNLQDFVLNLLNDEAEQTAYAADPTAALAQAGLGDLTPQDVQEVIPLVTDALPSETPLGDFAVDATGLMDGADSLGSSLSAS